MNAHPNKSQFDRDASVTGSTVFETRKNVQERAVACSTITTSFLKTIEDNKNLNSFITVDSKGAQETSKAIDERRAKGIEKPLDGIVIAAKDNFCTDGLLTTAASKMLSNFTPTYDATIISKLREAGAVIVGKTNMDEFAMGSSTESSFYKPTLNPAGFQLGINNLVPGGSSGGSAAAVAAGLVAGALGTDTGGSIRQPASFCGVVGFKPTYGICSRWGIVAYASSLDQAGVFAQNVKDAAILMDVISGVDEKDTTSINSQSLSFEKHTSSSKRKFRIGLPKEVTNLEHTPDTEEVWNQIEQSASEIGAELVEVSIPHFESSLPAYYIIALCEASSNLARYDGVRYGHRSKSADTIDQLYENSRAEGFGLEVQRRILLGTYALSAGYYDAYYLRALRTRKIITEEFSKAFQGVDVMMMPTTPGRAFEIGAHAEDPVSMYLQDVFTVPVNLSGLPAMSIPMRKTKSGLPLGLQIIGPQLGDETVFECAAQLETTL